MNSMDRSLYLLGLREQAASGAPLSADYIAGAAAGWDAREELAIEHEQDEER